MRTFLFSTAMIAGVVCTGVAPARAAPQPVLGFTATKVDVASVEDVGYRRRYYRRYGYPYAYYPPAYGYYPPPAYGYYAPAYPAYRYPYYAPYGYRYYEPYDAPY